MIPTTSYRFSRDLLTTSFVLGVALLPQRSIANTPATADLLRIAAVNHTIYQGSTAPRAFDLFNAISVDSAGRVTFDAYSNNASEHGIWTERDGGVLKEIVHTGDSHPSAISPYHFSVASTQTPIATENTIVFRDEFPDAPGPTGLGVWVSTPRQNMRLAATNKAAPEIIAPRVVNSESGVGLFYTNVSSQGYVAMNWFRNFVYESSPDNSLRLVVSQFDPAPGVPSAAFRDVGNPRVNESGQIAWDGTLGLGGSVTPTSMVGIWKQLTPGVGSLVARQGSPAPGTSNVPFDRFWSFTINNDGGVSLLSNLQGGNTASDVGIWREKPGVGLQPVMIEGDSAPGAGPGVTFSDISRISVQPVYDPSGNIVFNSNLAGPGVTAENDTGLWEYSGQSVRKVVREGDPAPGTEPGVVFDVITNPTVNQYGQVAFTAFLRGPGIDSDDNFGIWAEGPNGLTLVARRGNYYTDGTGNVVRIGNPQTFDLGSNGHIAFWAYDFANSAVSRAFVTDLTAVPEPGYLFLAIGALPTVICLPKRCRSRAARCRSTA